MWMNCPFAVDFLFSILYLSPNFNSPDFKDCVTMILYLMRHGQTDWNAKGKMQGWIDTPLNALGIEQAHNAIEIIKKEAPEIIYAGDLKRTRKTADIVAGALDLPVHYTKRLREMNLGKAEGVKKTDLEAKFSYTYQAFNDINCPDRYDVGYPGGETIGEVQQRFMKFFTRLLEDRRQKVLVVTHGLFIRIFTETCLKKSIKVSNGSILKVTYNEKTKKFRSPKIII